MESMPRGHRRCHELSEGFLAQPKLLSARRKDAIGSGNGASRSYTPSGRDFEIPGIDAILVNDQLRSPQRPADA